MKIYRNNTVIADVFAKESSYTYEEINGAYFAYLEFDAKNPIGLEIDDYIDYLGNKYCLRHQEDIAKVETSVGYEYRVKLYHDIYRLYDTVFWLFDEPDFNKRASAFYGTAASVLDLVVKCMNKNGSGWLVGSVVSTKTELFDFKDKLCGDVMNDLISTFNCEYWVEGRTINLGKRQYSSNGLKLSQGEGGGFRNLSVMAVDETPPITRLYAYGSDRNISPLPISEGGYGSDYLMLPDGKKFIEKNVAKYGRREAIQQFDDVYPKKEFVVTTKISNFILQSTDIDFNLTDYLLDGVEPIVTFQTGGLSGYDLTIKDGSWNNTTKQLELLPNKDENAIEVPGQINFEIGDVFIITGIKMPQKYITEAENVLLDKAQEWLDEKCEKRVQLHAVCDEIEFEIRNLYIACGQMVGIFDTNLDINREIRTIAVKRFINDHKIPASGDLTPYRYEITLSDFLQSNGLRQVIEEIKEVPKKIEQSVNSAKQYTIRRWQDVMETMQMMFDPSGNYFTEIIKPLVVHTAHLVVGTESQQMDFVGVYFIPNADGNPNLFKNTAGWLEHFTIDPSAIKIWNITAGTFSLLNNSPYYVYAKCSKANNSGEIIVTTDKIRVEDVAGYYHFWVGVLNSPRDGVRSWQPNYGYTEIAGQQITTGIIKDRLARLVINLLEGTIYGKITFAAGSEGYANISDAPDFETMISDLDAENVGSYLKTLASEKAGYDSAYTVLYSNTLLTGTAKTNLATAKTALNTSYTNLVNYINTAVADSLVSPAEKAQISALYTTYSNAVSTYSTRHEEAYTFVFASINTTAANAATDAGSALTKAEAASNTANAAQSTANNANTTANNANTLANTANTNANLRANVFYYTTSNPNSPLYQPSGLKTNDLLVTGTLIYRWTGVSWAEADKYTMQMTVINGGLISTGAITLGSPVTGGMAGDGSIRIWCGGSSASTSAMFRVESTGNVYSRGSFYALGSFYIHDANGTIDGGFSTAGTSTSSVRFWIGGNNPNNGNVRITSDALRIVSAGSNIMFDTTGFISTSGSRSAELRLNQNPQLNLKSDNKMLKMDYTGGVNGEVMEITNSTGNSSFQFGYWRYASEQFGRPYIRMVNPIMSNHLTGVTRRNVCWDQSSGYFYMEP